MAENGAEIDDPQDSIPLEQLPNPSLWVKIDPVTGLDLDPVQSLSGVPGNDVTEGRAITLTAPVPEDAQDQGFGFVVNQSLVVRKIIRRSDGQIWVISRHHHAYRLVGALKAAPGPSEHAEKPPSMRRTFRQRLARLLKWR